MYNLHTFDCIGFTGMAVKSLVLDVDTLDLDHIPHAAAAFAAFAHLHEGGARSERAALEDLDRWDPFARPGVATPPLLATLGSHFAETRRLLEAATRASVDAGKGPRLWRVYAARPLLKRRHGYAAEKAPVTHADGEARRYADGTFATAAAAFVLNVRHVYRTTVDALLASHVVRQAGIMPAITFISPNVIEDE